MSALDDAVLAVSLAGVTAAPRRSFTASSRAGVLATRRTAVPWRFSVDLLRAGLSVAPRLVARLSTHDAEGLRVLRFDVRMELGDSTWIDLAGLLEAALGDRLDDPPPQRWRTLIGAAINGALATTPRWVELHTPAGARRWAYDAGASGQDDPYVQQRIESVVTEGGFSIRVAQALEGVGGLWNRWVHKDEPGREVAKAWSWALGRSIEPGALAAGVVAERLEPGQAVSLGEVGRYWPADRGGLFLRRDGVRIAELGDVVSEAAGALVHGDLEAPGVGLDADGRRVRVDAGLHLAVAWMLADDRGPPTHVVDGGGTRRGVETLRDTDEVIYAWPHQLDSAFTTGLAALNALTPPQLESLRRACPATFVPAAVALESGGLPRVDLTALRQGSVGPIPLGHVEGESVEAYVHRHPVAREGQVQVHGYGRVLLRSPAPSLPGVTVICGIGSGPAERVAQGALERATARADMLTQAVLSAIDGDEARMRAPWYAHRWDALSPDELELRYDAHGEGVRLAWRDEPLLCTVVAHERDGTARTAAEALQRLRDVGGVVVSEPGGRWRTLESEAPAWAPWTLAPGGGELLVRLAGEGALWRMPMVPEVQLRPAPLREQRHVQLSRARADELRSALEGHGRAAEWARQGLLAHLLWATASAEDTHDLDGQQLLYAYDPQASRPWRKVSVQELRARPFAGVVPANAARRELTQPVVAAIPSVAHALVELGLVPAGAVRSTPRAKSTATVRPSKDREVWLRVRVVDRHAVGALTLADGAAGVEVWHDGLRSHTFTLPDPYAAVSGTVWLQTPGVSEDALQRVLTAAAAQLPASARRVLLLSAPGSARARVLRAFLESLPPSPAPEPAAHPVAAVLGSDRLAATLRFALGRACAVEVSRVSWSLVRDDEGLARVRLGGLHPMVRAAREEDASAATIGASAVAVLFELQRADRLSRRALDEGLARVLAALE